VSDGVDGKQHDDADDNAQHNANEYRHNDTWQQVRQVSAVAN